MTSSLTQETASSGGRVQRLKFENWPPPLVARSLSPNGSRQQHWATKRLNVNRVQARTALTARVQELKPMRGKVAIRAVWTFSQQRHRDPDNLSSGIFKATLDALVRGGWLEADDSDHVVLMPPEVRVVKGQRSLELRFEEVES